MTQRRLLPALVVALLGAPGPAGATLTLLANGTGQKAGYFQISAYDRQHAMAVGTHDKGDGSSEAVIAITSNGGTSWAVAKPSSGGGPLAIELYTSIAMSSPERALAGGLGKLWTTADGGATWTPYVEAGWSLLTGPTIGGVAMVGTPGFLAGSSGLLRKTLDGGATWTPLGSPVAGVDWAGVQALDASRLWIWAGSSIEDPDTGEVTGYEGGTLARSTDGGATFGVVFQGEARAVRPFLLNPTEGWMVSSSMSGPRLQKTTDGGGTWSDLAIPRGAAGAPDHLWQVHFFDRCEGLLLAETNEQTQLFLTDDRGATWTELDTAPLKITLPFPFEIRARLAAMAFTSREHGFLGGFFESLVRYDADGPGPSCGGAAGEDGGSGGGEDEGGCGCRAGGDGGAAHALAALGLALLLAARRRS